MSSSRQGRRDDLPPTWRRLDSLVLAATHGALFLIGSLFTLMIVLEVASRYFLDFSIFFINGAAQFLLVWFFLLGAGPALREGGHVGVEFLARAVSPSAGRALNGFAQALVFLFFCQMLWSGIAALPASWDQTEASTGLSLLWVMLAVPVGFVLLIYHQAAICASFRQRARETAA